MSDKEWSLVAPLIAPAKRGGRKREVDLYAGRGYLSDALLGYRRC
ncbi:MAG TPA: hypothetical protein VGF97_09030 [Rhizomicrobium sp.]|jgi:hypothetical protein